MSQELQGQRIAILAADGVERIELEQPRGALHGAGAQTVVRGRRQLTASRSPADLPAFCPAIIQQFAAVRQPASAL